MLSIQRKVSELGMIALPKEMRDKLDIKPKDSVNVILEDGGKEIIIRTIDNDK